MEKTRFMVLLGVVTMLGTTIANGQSKKEKILSLNYRVDSLQDALTTKSEEVVRLDVKLARIDGEIDARDQEIKRLETRDDSLKSALMTRRATIDSLAAKLTKLRIENDTLQAQQKELTGKNNELNAQLADLKQKPAAPTLTTKDAGPADAAKEESKTNNLAPPNKPDPVKNKPDQ